ncbi:ABC transporter ATP-binding protein [Spirulina sp. 06S082]|uniref:ABC transporter ATP-binding protein n=1 Tax=Spirulina sp. 06S082 TaxID=3110248 RepID=UPI002B216FEA|nr:ABC transporter ATP-binding protein [Spirulina sp. 06S082]MEA5469317.1 ABC transporter ATP-binding protein [Spirulina sp. 06S082]
MASFRDLLNHYRSYRAIAVFSIAASSFFQIVDLVVPYAIGQILNVLSGDSLDKAAQFLVANIAKITNLPEGQFLALGTLLGLIFLVTVIGVPIESWTGLWYHWAIALKVRRDSAHQTVKKILTLPLGFYDENNPGRVAGKVARGLSNHLWTYPEIAGEVIPKLMRILGIFGIICLIDGRIAIALLLSFILVLAFSGKKLRKLIRKEEILDRYMENTESRTSEIITNIKTVKAYANESQEFTRQKRRFDRELRFVLDRIHKGYIYLHIQQQIFVRSCEFFILGFTLWETLQGRISLGYFVTCLTVTSMAYSELNPLSDLAELFARRYASMVRFHEFLQEPEGSDAANLLPEVEGNSYHFTGKIELSGLTFGYDRDRPILQDISLLVEPYQTVALVGRSGSGKSTLVKLLFRYFEPDRGSILMDGDDIRSLDITRYRKRLAIVHQEVDIFNGTLLDNLVYGNPLASFSQVEEACQIARVDDFLGDLANGYYTIVGERGVRLSGGQRQRIGIARALIMNPDVLIFDEATSSLDYESERLIQLAMRSIFGTRTTIIIAHRLSTVREADKIVVLDSGRIVEVGSHAELLHKQGIYRRLHALQETGELV